VIALFLGGASSGKSVVAEGLAATLPLPVTYLATWVDDGPVPDPAMVARVAHHRARRPSHWRLLEVGADLASALRATSGTVLVDALGTWMVGAPDFCRDVDGLCRALVERPGDTVVVSEEVGLGVHPSTALGGAFRETLGEVNRRVAEVADQAWLVVAGRVLPLRPPEWGR